MQHISQIYRSLHLCSHSTSNTCDLVHLKTLIWFIKWDFCEFASWSILPKMCVLLTAMFDYLRFLLNRSALSENDFADFISLNNFSKQNSETDACMQKIGRNYFRKKSHHGRNLCRVGSLASMFIARCVHVLTYKHATKTVILATIFGHPSDNNNIVSHSRYFSFV